MIIDFRERGRGRERERERNIDWLPPESTPTRMDIQPRHVPGPGIEPATFYSNRAMFQLSHPAKGRMFLIFEQFLAIPVDTQYFN